MNEPTNPSDSTPPPPPPPPFTPPPSAETPPPPPPSISTPTASPISPPPSTPPPTAPPHPPIYTPPSGQPPKKSAMPWVLGGCGCLVLIIIVIVIVAMGVYRAKQKVVDFKTDFKSALRSIDEKSPASSKAGWTTYTNTKANLPANLQSDFIAFSFQYPKSFELQPQSEVNFVKVEKYTSAGKGNTAENFAVGYARFNDPTAQSDALYDGLLDQLGQQLAGGFHNYKELRRTFETVDGVRSRTALFQADFNDAAKTMIYGKTIVVHPAGKKNGVTILILGTSLGHDVKSPEDLGAKGDTAGILRSFRFL